jgi:DNA-binding FadR family transcriptional regulator
LARTDERFRGAFSATLDLCGTLSVGEQLPAEMPLAARLDVSRTVVRSVLDLMQTKGILRWEGREKTLLRRPLPPERPALPAGQITGE